MEDVVLEVRVCLSTTLGVTMGSQARERLLGSGPSSMQDSPSLSSRFGTAGGSDLLDEGDDSGFMDLNSKDFDKMNLVDTPPVQRMTKKTQFSSPGKPATAKRPSWGPKSSPQKGKMRLLEGVEDVVASTSSSEQSQVRRRERTLGGLGQEKQGMKARQSIFAKPLHMNSRRDDDEEQAKGNEREEDGDDSFYSKDPVLNSSTGSVKGRVAAIEASRSRSDLGQTLGVNAVAESKEQMDNQLAELKRMNTVFELYGNVLAGSIDQIDVSSWRRLEALGYVVADFDLFHRTSKSVSQKRMHCWILTST
jgi:hypothetical protein